MIDSTSTRSITIASWSPGSAGEDDDLITELGYPTDATTQHDRLARMMLVREIIPLDLLVARDGEAIVGLAMVASLDLALDVGTVAELRARRPGRSPRGADRRAPRPCHSGVGPSTWCSSAQTADKRTPHRRTSLLRTARFHPGDGIPHRHDHPVTPCWSHPHARRCTHRSSSHRPGRQHHMTYRRATFGFREDNATFFQWRRDHHVTIGNDVWIGHATITMPGVRSGDGAVIGSAAVTREVAPYTIIGGVPRKVAERLQRIAWWDWTRRELEARFDDLLDLDIFLATHDPPTEYAS